MPVAAITDQAQRRWWAGLFVALAVVTLVNPIGFMGGGWDDWQYLNSARCWLANGPCLPLDHWQGRWPVIAPLAAVIGAMGESRAAIGLAPLAASLACLILVALIGNRLWRPPVGFVAALLLLVTPAFAIQILDPSVEAVELGFVLLAVLSLLHWLERRAIGWLGLAGLSLGLAFQVRETAIIAAGFGGMFGLIQRPRPTARELAVAAAAFLLPLLVEGLVFYVSVGDPLWRRRLSLAHTLIPSTELLGPVDRRHLPFFNPAYIGNWRHEPGVHLHWAIDGLVNLLINAKTGCSLLLAPLLAAVLRRQLGIRDKRTIKWLCAGALIYIAMLIYGFAVDPKARMMFVPLTATSLALALLLTRLRESGKTGLLAAAIAMPLIVGGVILFVHQRMFTAEPLAARVIAAHPNALETTDNTRRHLALVPGIETLGRLGSGREYLLLKIDMGCARWTRQSGLDAAGLALVDEELLSRAGNISSGFGGALCVFRYDRPVAPRAILENVDAIQPKYRIMRAAGANSAHPRTDG